MPTMPNVVGLELPAALASLVSAGVRVLPLGYFQADPVTVTWSLEAGIKGGWVAAQTPSSGTTVAANSAVNLTASAFPVAVSNYGGVGS